jgi:peptidyl-prolyl cis-trans isomerase A (cyclophilin A)
MDIVGFLKDHKQILLPVAGLVVVILLMGFFSSSLTNFSVNNVLDTTNIVNLDTSKNDKYTSAPPHSLKDGIDYQADIKTNHGTISVDLLEKDTPITVNNFVFLAQDSFYNNTTFHRIIPNFMIQGGDPLGTGTGGPGYSFEDEIDADALGLDDMLVSETSFLSSFYAPNVLAEYANRSVKELYEDIGGYEYTSGFGKEEFGPFVLAMANSGPSSNGSQFFITTRNTSSTHLNGKHTIFGRVISGQNIVDQIERVNTDANGKPSAPVIIESVTILER